MATERAADEGLRIVRVLERDPELGRGIEPDQVAFATRELTAHCMILDAGEVESPESIHIRPAELGLLVLDGLIMRIQGVGSVVSAELLGAGDVIRPWMSGDEGSSMEWPARWHVMQPTEVAFLDRRFMTLAGRWPDVLLALFERSVQRSRLLGFQMGIGHLRRVDARLLLLFWSLADRWGRVTPDGVVMPIKLTHGWLAMLVGAQRPSVTTALGQLSQAGRVQRMHDGAWLLRGRPPETGDSLFAGGA